MKARTLNRSSKLNLKKSCTDVWRKAFILCVIVVKQTDTKTLRTEDSASALSYPPSLPCPQSTLESISQGIEFVLVPIHHSLMLSIVFFWPSYYFFFHQNDQTKICINLSLSNVFKDESCPIEQFIHTYCYIEATFCISNVSVRG